MGTWNVPSLDVTNSFCAVIEAAHAALLCLYESKIRRLALKADKLA
jgi:hypothetical protein